MLLYDGEGCLSLHVLFVERGGARLARRRSARCLRRAIENGRAAFAAQRRRNIEAPRDARWRAIVATFRTAVAGARLVTERAERSTSLRSRRSTKPPLLVPRASTFARSSTARRARVSQRHRISPRSARGRAPSARPARARGRRCGAARITPFGSLQAPPLGNIRTAAGRASPSSSAGSSTKRERGTRSLVTKFRDRAPRSSPTLARARIAQRHLSRRGFPVFWESADGATVDRRRRQPLHRLHRGLRRRQRRPLQSPRRSTPLREQARRARARHGRRASYRRSACELFERLAQILPSGLDKDFLATTGSEAVEAALKTRDAPHRQDRALRPIAAPITAFRSARSPSAESSAFASRLPARSAPQPLLLDYPAETYDERSGRHRRRTRARSRARRRYRGGHHRADSRTRRRASFRRAAICELARALRRAGASS